MVIIVGTAGYRIRRPKLVKTLLGGSGELSKWVNNTDLVPLE